MARKDNQDITLLTPNFLAVRAMEGVELVGQDQELLRLIRRESKGEDLQDAVNHAVNVRALSARKRVICQNLRFVGNHTGLTRTDRKSKIINIKQ